MKDLGFAGLYRSDHYTNSSPPEKDSLELWVSLTYLATHTKRIQFGPLVAPFSFRHPSITARMAAAVDDLSGGRLQLGLGAGWNQREHNMFGLDLLETGARLRRFEEGLEVVTQLLQSDACITFRGEFYQLKDAILLPRPADHPSWLAAMANSVSWAWRPNTAMNGTAPGTRRKVSANGVKSSMKK